VTQQTESQEKQSFKQFGEFFSFKDYYQDVINTVHDYADLQGK